MQGIRPVLHLLSASLTLAQTQPTNIAWLYAGFVALVLLFLALDLGVFHRDAHVVTVKEAAAWSTVWITCALSFTVFIYFAYHSQWFGLGQSVPVVGSPGKFMTLDGMTAAEQYLAGYIVEWSLSVDNMFVIAVIFSYFAVPAKYQHRVLFWGILGALAMRGIMIAVGSALLQRYGWITYIFGGFLILTAIKMAFAGSEGVHPDKNILVRIVRRFWPITSHYDGQKFFTKIPGPEGNMRRAATPLFLALLVVEFTDLVFAVDSIPAIFAITGDPFIVLTSNVFAILGLRSLYFLLAHMLRRFRFLKVSLVLILLFVGVKMLLVHSTYKIDTTVSLVVIVGLLASGIVTSLLLTSKAPRVDT
jgi:tellurite resistance protein TerC